MKWTIRLAVIARLIETEKLLRNTEHRTPEFWVSVKEAPLGGVLISRIPVIF